MPKSERGGEIGRMEFKEDWNQGLIDWGITEAILLKEVDNYHEMANYEQGKASK